MRKNKVHTFIDPKYKSPNVPLRQFAKWPLLKIRRKKTWYNFILKSECDVSYLRTQFVFQVKKYLSKIEREGTERVKMFLGMHPSHQKHNGGKMRPAFDVNELGPFTVGCAFGLGWHFLYSDNHRISHLLGATVRGDPCQLGLGLRGRQGEHCARGN